MKIQSLLLAAALLLGASALRAQEHVSHGRFADVALYRPAGKPSSVVLFLSGDGGWNRGVDEMASALGSITFPLVLEYASDIVTVGDRALLDAMFYVWERLKLVVEPTGALAVAAILEGLAPKGARRIGVVLSGGNVDLSQVSRWRASA